MKRTKYSLLYAKDLSVLLGGSTGNNEMVEFTSLWAGIKYVIQTKAARGAIRAGRYCWVRIVPKAPMPKTEEGASS